MFGYLSIFSGIEISIFRDVLPDAVCRFAKIAAKIGKMCIRDRLRGALRLSQFQTVLKGIAGFRAKL